MAFGIWFFPIWIMVFVFLFAIFLIIFWLWAILNCLNSRLSPIQKIFWVIIILLFSLIGALLYFLLSKSMEEKMAKSKKFKGKKLFRSKNRMIAGVCAGLGEYMGVDPTIVRLIWVVFSFFSLGAGILAYVIAWVIIPEK